jgi:hypothetical protein
VILKLSLHEKVFPYICSFLLTLLKMEIIPELESYDSAIMTEGPYLLGAEDISTELVLSYQTKDKIVQLVSTSASYTKGQGTPFNFKP